MELPVTTTLPKADPSALQLSHFEARTTALGQPSDPYNVLELIAQGSSEAKNFIYYQAENTKTKKVYEGLIRNNSVFDPSIPPGEYQITACEGVWQYNASNTKKASLKQIALYPGRSFYCGKSTTLKTAYKGFGVKANLQKQAMEVYRREVALIKILYQFTDRLRLYLASSPSDADTIRAVQNTLNLNEFFVLYALGPEYDSLVPFHLNYHDTAATLSRKDSSSGLQLSAGQNRCISINSLTAALEAPSLGLTADTKLKNFGILLLALANIQSAETGDSSSQALRLQNKKALIAMVSQHKDQKKSITHEPNTKWTNPLSRYSGHILVLGIYAVLGVSVAALLGGFDLSTENATFLEEINELGQAFHEKRILYQAALSEFRKSLLSP